MAQQLFTLNATDSQHASQAEQFAGVEDRHELFYPTGYISVAFADQAELEQAHTALLAAGWAAEELRPFTARQVLERIATVMARPSWLRDALVWFPSEEQRLRDQYLSVARQGGCFLLVHAPEESRRRKAQAELFRFAILLARYYGHWTITTLSRPLAPCVV